MRSTTVAVLLALSCATPALAQPAPLAGTGPNGGRLGEDGRWRAELVAKGDAISVFLSDSAGKPLAADGFEGTAILFLNRRLERIVLEPRGDRLVGTTPAELGERPTGALRLIGPDGVSVGIRFD